MIPKDWEIASLFEISRKITDGEHVTPIREKSGYFLLSARNVLNGRIDVSDVDFVGRDEFLRIRQRCNPEPGDLLISCSGTIGRVTVVPKGFECVLVRSAALVKPIHEKVHSYFIQHWLQSERAQKQISNSVNQGAQPNLFLNHIERLTSPRPNILEQKAIAEALSDADALIESLDQLLAKKRQIKQGAMQELLTGKRRLSGFHGEWEIKRLGDLADMGSGGTPPSSNPNFYDGDIPWVSISDMTKGGKLIASTERNLSIIGFSNCAAQMFPAGTVLYAMYASLGECSIASVPLCSSQAILGIRVKANLCSEFLYYYLQSIKPKVKTLGQQGTQANLNKRMVQDFSLQLPPIIEQNTIATVLSDMDTELTALEARLTKACQVKQGMMQELLTGRIRLL